MKRTIGLRMFAWLLVLLIMPATALAANWMSLQRLEGTRLGPCQEYFDTESMSKKDNRLVYWSLWLMENPAGPRGISKVLWQKELLLAEPKQIRTLAYYQYDSAGLEAFSYQKPGGFTLVDEHSPGARVLQYLDGAAFNTAAKPTDLAAALPNWLADQKSYPDFQLYIDRNSIQALVRTEPGVLPATFEMTVKRVWTEAGSAARTAELNRVKPTRQPYAMVAYTVTTYRFQSNENSFRRLWISDHDAKGIPLAFAAETNWTGILSDSAEAGIFARGARWFRETRNQ